MSDSELCNYDHHDRGWRYDEEHVCQACGLYACGIEEFAVCEECDQCLSCGHAKGCPNDLGSPNVEGNP
jgi:hypothetical protein